MKALLASAIFAAAIGVAAASCSAMEADSMAGSAAPGGSTGVGGSGAKDAGIDAIVGQGGDSSGPFTYAEYCGEGCTPSTGASQDPCHEGGGGVGGSGGSGGSSGGGGADGDGGGGGAIVETCQLVTDGESVWGQCAPAGEAGDSDPCLDTADCGPGLGCVKPGVCRPYCCGDLEACPLETYCALEPLAQQEAGKGDAADPDIPVCVPASNCTLLDDASCPEGLTCTIVRSDGTTSCVEPGGGRLGDGCPCAAGYVCATGADECLMLCKTGNAGDCPDGYNCQGGSSAYPDGFGVCVGG